MDKNYIPKHLDDSFKFVMWSIDECIVMIIPFMLGMLCRHYYLGLLLGISFVWLFKKLKGEEGSRYLFHLMFWYLPEMYKLKSTPPSYVRNILG